MLQSLPQGPKSLPYSSKTCAKMKTCAPIKIQFQYKLAHNLILVHLGWIHSFWLWFRSPIWSRYLQKGDMDCYMGNTWFLDDACSVVESHLEDIPPALHWLQKELKYVI